MSHETEQQATRDEAAETFRRVAAGIAAGSIRFDAGDDAVDVTIPDEVTLELELDVDDDEVGLELELEWPRSAGDVTEAAGPAVEDEPTDEDRPTAAEAAASQETLARFELFQDKRDEWRWRLVHRNGNVIATSGEGYSRKHNAKKGLRSVVRNAPEADVHEESDS